MLGRIGLVLIGPNPWSATFIKTKYKLCSIVVYLLISFVVRHEKEVVVHKRQRALVSRLKFARLTFMVMENMHSTSTDDALLVSTASTMLYQ